MTPWRYSYKIRLQTVVVLTPLGQKDRQTSFYHIARQHVMENSFFCATKRQRGCLNRYRDILTINHAALLVSQSV